MVIQVALGILTHVLTSIILLLEVNERGEEYTSQDDIHVSFELNAHTQEHSSNAFAYAYYHDELKAKGFNPNFALQWGNERKNPRYYEEESRIDSYLGINRRNENDQQYIQSI
jgi:hypothetical protein